MGGKLTLYASLLALPIGPKEEQLTLYVTGQLGVPSLEPHDEQGVALVDLTHRDEENLESKKDRVGPSGPCCIGERMNTHESGPSANYYTCRAEP